MGSKRAAITQPMVVGIDVGGPKKGLHAVALRGGQYHDKLATCKVDEMVRWCRALGATVIAIDAPCGWSTDGKGRPAEQELMKQQIWCFSSPLRSKAIGHPTNYYGWMLFGEELYRALKPTHPVTTVWPPVLERYCFETFPHAITWHLRGGNATARNKRVQRTQALEAMGVSTEALTNIDLLDAALCALTAHLAMTNTSLLKFGEGVTGFIMVPPMRPA